MQWLQYVSQNYRWGNPWFIRRSCRRNQLPRCTSSRILFPNVANLSYIGIPKEIMHNNFRGEVVYNAESDQHFASLTVGQTLEFAAKARTPRSRLPGVTREQWAIHMKDVMLSIFGLTHVEHTKIGNVFVRGVSGGERKRVSIAEVALSGSALQCWDNSTRGLDSASALEFVKNVRISTKYSNTTAVVAIYQASQDIYDVRGSIHIPFSWLTCP
jgi:ATP-binding cassette, subfamily G (WHITE), member 2, PDR